MYLRGFTIVLPGQHVSKKKTADHTNTADSFPRWSQDT